MRQAQVMLPITTFRRAILGLVHKFCYDGLTCTKYAERRGREIVLVPNDLPGLRFKCERGVPEAFLRACVNAPSQVRSKELWGTEYVDLTAELKYLFDRKLLDSYCTKYKPALGAFTNPFDNSEIVSAFAHDPDGKVGYQDSWVVSHSLSAAIREDWTLSEQRFFQLTAAGHDVLFPLPPAQGVVGVPLSKKPTRQGAKPKRARRRRKPRTEPTAEMMEVYRAHLAGFTFRAIADERKRLGQKGRSATTISTWCQIAKSALDPPARSKRIRNRLPEDRDGQVAVSRDRRRPGPTDAD